MIVNGPDNKQYNVPDDATDTEILGLFGETQPQTKPAAATKPVMPQLDTIPAHKQADFAKSGSVRDVMGIASPSGRAQAQQAKKPLRAFAESIPSGLAKIGDTAAALVGALAENPETSLASKVQRNLTEPAIQYWNDQKTPSALPTLGETVGASLGELAPTMMLGPGALPTMAATATYQTGKDLVDAGIPLEAAQKAAMMQGGGAAAMGAIPGAAPTLGKTALLALANPVTGIAQRAATREFLKPYNPEVAEGFDPLDPASLIMDVAMAGPGIASHFPMKAAAKAKAEAISRPADPFAKPVEPTAPIAEPQRQAAPQSPNLDYTKTLPAEGAHNRYNFELGAAKNPATTKAVVELPPETTPDIAKGLGKSTGLAPIRVGDSFYLVNTQKASVAFAKRDIKAGTHGNLLGYGTESIPENGVPWMVDLNGHGSVDVNEIAQSSTVDKIGISGVAPDMQTAIAKITEFGRNDAEIRGVPAIDQKGEIALDTEPRETEVIAPQQSEVIPNGEEGQGQRREVLGEVTPDAPRMAESVPGAETFNRLSPNGKRGSAEAFTVNISPSKLQSLAEIRQEISDGEAGKRIATNMERNDTGPKEQVSWGSTFPEYFQNKNLTKKQVLPVLDRILKGESVTEVQWLMAEDMLQAKRYDTLNKILSDRAKKYAESETSISNVSDEDLARANQMADDFFAQFGGDNETTASVAGDVRQDATRETDGSAATSGGKARVGEAATTERTAETTSIKNAVTDVERAADNLPPIETPPEVKPIKDSLSEGKRMVETGEFSSATIDSIIKTPRTLSDSENMALLYMKQRNRNAHDIVTEKIIEARKNSDVATIEALKAERDAIETERQSIDMAGKAAGTEWGRAGRARQEEMAQDYSLQRNIQRARAASPSGEITDAHRAEIESLTKRLETVMKETETKSEKIAQLEAEIALKTMRRKEKSATRKSTRKATRETLDAEFADLTKELNKALNRPANANPMLNPSTVILLGKMAKNRVQKGMTRVADVVDSIHMSIEGALDKREIRDAISGYGKIIKMDNSPTAKQYREVKKKARLMSAVEDLIEGRDPLKSGFEMDKDVSPEVKVLLKQIDQMKKGVVPDVAPEIAAKESFMAKTERQVATIQKALRKSIEEYTRKIQEKEFEPKKSESIAPSTPEISELRKQRENLAEVYRAMKSESSGKPTAEEIRIKSIEKAIAGYEQRIANRDISMIPRKEGITSPKIEELKARRDKLKATLDQLRRDAKPKIDPETIRLKAYKTRLNKRITELEKQLETNDFTKKQRSPLQMDQEARHLAAKVEDLKREIDAVVNPMTVGKKARAIFTEAWKAGLLSGPKTHIVNITSNALTIGFKPVENLIASGVESVRSKVTGQKREVFTGEAVAGLVGLRAGVDEGFRRAARGWAESLPPEEMAKAHDAHNQNAIGGRTGKIVRIPFRALSAADGFFKGIAQSSEVYRLAFKQASSEGLKGEQLKTRMAEIIQDPGAKIIDAAIKEADYRTFNSEFGPFGKHIAATRRIPYVGLVADILMPFIRTPINIIKYGLERTPVNYGRLLYKSIKGEIKGGALSEEMAKPVMGTMIAAAVVNGVISGYITGGGPKDKSEKEALYRTGWQPYSFKIGDKYYSYNRFEPLGMVVGSTADFADLAFGKESNVKSLADAANVVALSIVKNWTSKTFMQSLSAALDATSDPKRYGGQFINGYARSLIPSIVNTVTDIADENRRDMTSISDVMQARIPVLSEQLPAKFDLWGRPVMKPGLSAIDRAFSPIVISQERKNPVDKELLRLGLSPGMPTRKIQGNELTPEQYNQYVQIAGKRAYARVARIVASAAPDESKKRQITNAISEQREITRGQLMRKWKLRRIKD